MRYSLIFPPIKKLNNATDARTKLSFKFACKLSFLHKLILIFLIKLVQPQWRKSFQ
jgi:hypothetical protein